LKIAEIIEGGPLDKEHIKVEEGMIITEIDGQPITKTTDFAQYLNHKSGKYTSLKIKSSDNEKSDYITVKPVSLGQERSLLYKRWVKKNEEDVKRLSKGRLGYVHIPGMSDGPYRNTYEKVMGKYYECDGLIVDTRFNGGGDLVGDFKHVFNGRKLYAICH
jgi:tricorn protease